MQVGVSGSVVNWVSLCLAGGEVFACTYVITLVCLGCVCLGLGHVGVKVAELDSKWCCFHTTIWGSVLK